MKVKKGKPYTRRRRIAATGLVTALSCSATFLNYAYENYETVSSTENADGISGDTECPVLEEISSSPLRIYADTPPNSSLSQNEDEAKSRNEFVIRSLAGLGIQGEIVTVADIDSKAVVSADIKYEGLEPTESIVNQSSLLSGALILPDELLRVLNPHVKFVDSIDTKPDDPLYGGAGGLHIVDNAEVTVGTSSKIVLLKDSKDETLIHELGHALQFKLCNKGSEFQATIKRLQDSGELHPYLRDFLLTIDQRVAELSSYRQYPEPYGAQNPEEHWATMFEQIILMRGIVMEGDKDWGSPYHQVQSAMINDIERQFPGFIQYLTKITALRRMSSNSEFNKLHASQVEQRYILDSEREHLEAAINFVVDLYQTKFLSFRYLRNSIIVYNPDPTAFNSEFNSVLLRDPLIAEDEYGRTYIAYSSSNSIANTTPYLHVLPYEPSKMVILDRGNIDVVEPGEGDIISFIDNTTLGVNGTRIAYVQDFLNTETAVDTYVELLYTTKLVTPKTFEEMVQKGSEFPGL